VSAFILAHLATVLSTLSWSKGPGGWVAWVQPAHVSAGVAWAHGHLSGWFEVR
jgi:hypothetical protein